MSDTQVTDARPGDAPSDAPSDADLITAVRGGDVEAYGELYARHVDSARRLARSLSSDGEADDLVSEAFAKVLVVLQRGEGPDTALRPYLLTALRRLHVDRVRSVTRTRPTDDIAAFDAGEAFHDTAVADFESGAAARAFGSLPERWQLVLWHLEVEGQKPAEVAPLLGISANSVSALAYRAREGLRQAFVSMHAQDADDERCAVARARLGAFIRNDVSKREGAAVESHLRDCRECAAIYLELVEVNSDLRALIAPLILGGAAATYLASTTAGVVGGVVGGSGAAGLLAGVGGFLGKSWGRTLAGAAAAGVVVAGVVGVVHTDDPKVATNANQVTTTDPVDARAPAKVGTPTNPAPLAPAQPSDEPTSDASQPDPDPDPIPTSSGRPDEPRNPVDPDHSDGPDQSDHTSDGPEDEPTTDPSTTITTSPVETSAQPTAGGLLWDVTIRVTGLAAAESGTLTVTLDRPALGLVLDPRCDLVNLGSLSCRLQGPGTIQLVVTPMPGAVTVLTATLSPGDHRSSVRLG